MPSSNKIKPLAEAIKLVEEWKNNSETIVFSNGCFDIIHLGHVDYLENARKLGKRLIVGLNSDNSVSKLKGQNRPINDIASRSRILASLEFVDLVIVFDEDTPYELIQELIPDILVKGDDYLAENIVGADIVKKYGGSVVTIPLIKGYSTSSIINKIRD